MIDDADFAERTVPCAVRSRTESASIIHALSKCYDAPLTAGYANDSWAEVSIGWWGGEP